MRRAALALAAALCATPAATGRAAKHDIPWFEANPAARKAWLRACGADHRLARSARCANAESAESAAYARRLARRGGISGDGALPPSFRTPLVLEAERRACARPPGQRGLFAPACRSL